jgi:hypothetical protein
VSENLDLILAILLGRKVRDDAGLWHVFDADGNEISDTAGVLLRGNIGALLTWPNPVIEGVVQQAAAIGGGAKSAARILVLRAAALAREAEAALADAHLAHLCTARLREHERAGAGPALIVGALGLAAERSGLSARAVAKLDTARIARLDDEALAAGLI